MKQTFWDPFTLVPCYANGVEAFWEDGVLMDMNILDMIQEGRPFSHSLKPCFRWCSCPIDVVSDGSHPPLYFLAVHFFADFV